MKILLTILLALIPIIFWYLQYHFSKKDKRLSSFKNHWICYRLDIIFIPINLLFLFSVDSSFLILALLPLIFLINLSLHRMWGKKIKGKGKNDHIFQKRKEKLSKAGIAHLIFSTIQMTIITSMFLLPPISNLYLIEMALTSTFGLLTLYGSYKINKKLALTDIIISTTIILIPIIRTVILIS